MAVFPLRLKVGHPNIQVSVCDTGPYHTSSKNLSHYNYLKEK